jgi:hypothetical protein
MAEPLPPLAADEIAFVRSQLADTIWRRNPLEAPMFLKRYGSGPHKGQLRQRGAQALIDDGSLLIVRDGEGIIHVAFTARGLRRLGAALADKRRFPEARFSWLRGELVRLSGG